VHDGRNDADPLSDDRPILGTDSFLEGFRERLRSSANLTEIPRVQRFAARPTLQEIFSDARDRRERNSRILTAHVSHGYTLTQIARHLKLHLTTVSRAVSTLKRKT
jgi:DNA-binding NarL/FixJ family response regulator